MVFDGRYKLIKGFDPDVAGPQRSAPKDAPVVTVLFDLKLDPQENVNFAREAPGVVERLTKILG